MRLVSGLRALTIVAVALLVFSAAAQTTMFTVTNNTRGKFKDNDVFWAILGRDAGGRFVHVDQEGRLVPMSVADNTAKGHLTKNGQDYSNYFHSIAEAPSIPVPRIGSSRVFISLGSPMYIRVMPDGYAGADVNNPSDPNAKVFFDFVEFTIDERGFHGNTTQVDAFGFPIVLELTDEGGQVKKVGHAESRAALFAAFKRETPREFDSCVRAPYRIVAPNSADFGKDKAHARYFDKYLDDIWKKFSKKQNLPGGWTGEVVNGVMIFKNGGQLFESPKPTTQEAFLGSGVLATNPAFCAAINRRVLEDPASWRDPRKFYKGKPANFYAKFWHDHSIDGRAYGFCYDDFAGQDTLIEAARPKSLNIIVGWD